MPRRLILLVLTCPGWLIPPACSKKTEPHSHPAILSLFEQFPEDKGKVETDRWYVIELQGKPAGWSHTRVTRHETPRGSRWVTDSDEFVTVRRGVETTKDRLEKKIMENERGQLLRFWQMEQELGGEKLVTQAGKARAEMVTIRGPEIHRVPFDPKAFATFRYYQILFSEKAPEAGEARTFRSYEYSNAGYADNRVIVKSAGPEVTELEHMTTALPGVVAKIKLDANFLITHVDVRTGVLHLAYQQVDDKPDIGNAAPDIEALMVIPSNKKMDNRDAVDRVHYRIQGLPEFVDSSWLSGPGQRVTRNPSPGVFVIDVEKLEDPPNSPFPPNTRNPELKKYLASTSLARLEDPEIIEVAKKVTAGAPDAWTAAKRLRSWVSEEIEGSMGMGFASASQVMKEREGDCSEQSVLLATLARSVGIPARCVVGLVYQEGAFYRHMWTEVWVGRWQPLDPAQATDMISAAWIRLAPYSLQLTNDEKSGAGAVVLFGSQLKVTVEKVETAKH